jgi:hypothetical protein
MVCLSRNRRRSIAVVILAIAVLLSALTGVASARRNCSGIAWHTLRDGTQYCPRTHGLLADVNWIDLSWSSWGGTVATGHGYSAHDIFPNGHLAEYLSPIRIRLFDPKQCSAHLRVYSEITVSRYSHTGQKLLSRETRPIPCSGETGGGNG